MRWKVHLDNAPRSSLNYFFLRSSFDPDDIANVQNVEEKVLDPPKNFKFDPDLTVELKVADDGTATPRFIYHMGRNEDDSVDQPGRPFFLDMTTSDTSPFGKAYIGFDLGTSNTSISFVNETAIEIFERGSQEHSWNELSDLASTLPLWLVRIKNTCLSGRSLSGKSDLVSSLGLASGRALPVRREFRLGLPVQGVRGFYRANVRQCRREFARVAAQIFSGTLNSIVGDRYA